MNFLYLLTQISNKNADLYQILLKILKEALP